MVLQWLQTAVSMGQVSSSRFTLLAANCATAAHFSRSALLQLHELLLPSPWAAWDLARLQQGCRVAAALP